MTPLPAGPGFVLGSMASAQGQEKPLCVLGPGHWQGCELLLELLALWSPGKEGTRGMVAGCVWEELRRSGFAWLSRSGFAWLSFAEHCF